MTSHFLIIDLNSWADGVLFRKSFTTHISCRVLSMVFFSDNFNVSGLGLWSMWSYILCKMIETGLISFFYMRTSNFPSTICWRCIFPAYILISLSNIMLVRLHILMFGSSLFHRSKHLPSSILFGILDIEPRLDLVDWGGSMKGGDQRNP